LSGYQEEAKLTDEERNILFLAIKARASQSIIGAYHTVSIEPENREYLMSEASKAEIILNKMCKINNDDFFKIIS